MSHYRSNVRDLKFTLFDMLGVHEALPADLDRETVEAMIDEVDRLARGPLAESYASCDRNPPVFDPATSTVRLPEEFKKAFSAYMDGGWWRLDVPPELGGTPVPRALWWALVELVQAMREGLGFDTVLTDETMPELTGTDPASLSRAAVQLLRTGTGYKGPAFDGPVFTDDLSSMAAINDRYSVPEAVLRALQAGNDVALWVTTDEVPAVLDRLEKAVAAGELTMPNVDASVLRIAKFKGPKPDCGR